MTENKDQQVKDATKAAEAAAQASETVEGGKYLAEDGKTLVDANGKPLSGKKAE